jgi:hypothetical protein
MIKNRNYSAVISIKHVSYFVNKVENPYVTMMNFDLIDKCRYVFYAYDGSIINVEFNEFNFDVKI